MRRPAWCASAGTTRTGTGTSRCFKRASLSSFGRPLEFRNVAFPRQFFPNAALKVNSDAVQGSRAGRIAEDAIGCEDTADRVCSVGSVRDARWRGMLPRMLQKRADLAVVSSKKVLFALGGRHGSVRHALGRKLRPGALAAGWRGLAEDAPRALRI